MLAILAVVVIVKVGQQVVGWVVHRDERAELARMLAVLEDEGFGVIETQVRADSLRLSVQRMDEQLTTDRGGIERLERALTFGSVSPVTEREYRGQIDAYNTSVEARNEQYLRWRETVEANHRHVARYNALVDSVRAVAEAIGEPYMPIPTPAEIAQRRRPSSAPGAQERM